MNDEELCLVCYEIIPFHNVPIHILQESQVKLADELAKLQLRVRALECGSQSTAKE